MNAGVRVVSCDADSALVGSPDSEAGGSGADVFVVFGPTPLAPDPGAPAIRWLDRAPVSTAAASVRLIAPAGNALWSRRPWPAADVLFELPAAPEPHRALLVGDRDGLRATLLAGAAERGLELDTAGRLTVDALRQAACVVLLDGEPGVISAFAPAVLAARRILISPAVDTAFGLQAPLDHLQFDVPERALNLVGSVLSQPTAFERLRTWGALAAERHRASRVYAQLAIDLAAEGPARV